MSSCYLDCCPAFFKVYLPQFCSRRLQIPAAFESHIKGEVPQASTIRSCRGTKWKVTIRIDQDEEEEEEGLYLKEGWSKFVEDNALEVGEFLVFYYDQPKSIFTVKVFSRSCCEKKKKNGPLNTRVQVKRERSSDDEHDVAPGSPATSHRSNLGLEKANRYRPQHPSFRVVLSHTYVTKTFLYIPRNFWKTHVEGNSRAELECSGKSWKVEMQFRVCSGRIESGWLEFVRDNGLSVGDVCIFELLNLSTTVFKVSIFRSQPN